MKKISVFLPLMVLLLALSSSVKSQEAFGPLYAKLSMSAVNFNRVGETLEVYVKSPAATTYTKIMTHNVPGATSFPVYTMAQSDYIQVGSLVQVKKLSGGTVTQFGPIENSLDFIITKDANGRFFANFYE